MKASTSFAKEKINVLLVGGIHSSAVEAFHAAGYTSVRLLNKELTEQELIEAISSVHMLGIRSATQITRNVLEHGKKLLTVGCFCIGTNQVDLHAAKLNGVPVFNAPFSNTRSVAELVMAEAIMLLRGIPAKNAAMHRGEWKKSANGSYEVRGKTLGIVGYGHIGTQVGILAEALGMRVLYNDITAQLSIGNAQPVSSLPELLSISDVVTIHVPGGDTTKNLIGAEQLRVMKPGAFLINASRGQVIDLQALTASLANGHLAGAALDVYPAEPKSSGQSFSSPLQEMDNVLLTPHIAGSTIEAQERIGAEVAESLISYVDTGSTASSVNFPSVTLPEYTGRHRVLHIHRNQPGVLAAANEVFAKESVNIAGQFLQTDADIGYVVTDIDQQRGTNLIEELKAIPSTIRARILY
ncbi:MAG: phosphoglycerate dehydrogenase [Candidatus Peribacteraceae bacterium]